MLWSDVKLQYAEEVIYEASCPLFVKMFIVCLVEASSIAACVPVGLRPENPGSTPSADKLYTGYHTFGVDEN